MLHNIYDLCLFYTFRLKVENGSITLVLGNGDKVPIYMLTKIHVKIQQYHSQSICLVCKLSDGVNLILGNNYLVQHKACLEFQIECCVFYKGHHKMNMYMNLVHKQSPNRHRLNVMQFNQSIDKGAISFLVQLIMIGDDVEDTMAHLMPKCWRNLLMCFNLCQVGYLHSGNWLILFHFSIR